MYRSTYNRYGLACHDAITVTLLKLVEEKEVDTDRYCIYLPIKTGHKLAKKLATILMGNIAIPIGPNLYFLLQNEPLLMYI